MKQGKWMRSGLTLLTLLLVAALAQATVVLTIPSIPDQLPGDTFDVPVEISNTTGLQILTFDFTFCYDSSALEYMGMEVNLPSISGDTWMVEDNLVSPGRVEVVGFGRDTSDYMSGSGTFVTFSFRVRDDAVWNQCYDFFFDTDPCCDPEFDGQTVIAHDGQFCIPVQPSVVVCGYVKTPQMHCDCGDCDGECNPVGVPGMTVSLYSTDCEPCDPGELVAQTETNSQGRYCFTVTQSGSYKIVLEPTCYAGPDFHGQIDVEQVNICDLYYLQRFLLNLENLNACPIECDNASVYPQMVTADVNFDYIVNVQDAPVEWQLVSNVADPNYNGLPAGEWCWTAVCYEDFDLEIEVPSSGQHYYSGQVPTWTVLLPGDVDLTYTDCNEKSVVRLVAPKLYGVDNQADVTIKLVDVMNFHSGQFLLRYDPTVVAISDVSLAEDVAGAQLWTSQSERGSIFVGVTSPDRDYSGDVLDLVTFRATMISDNPDARSPLTFESVYFNGGYSNAEDGFITREALANEDHSWSFVKGLYK